MLRTLLLTLFAILTLTTATPLRHKPDFNFKDGTPSLHPISNSHTPTNSDSSLGNNRLDCPAAGGTKFTGPAGGKWGILCGWDTKSKTFKWGPIYGISFEQCMMTCAQTDGCTVATYTGTCYLKASAKGKGYVYTGGNVQVAIRL
jgi:hypothetical protein